jgi:hypothetical protein
MQVRARAVLKLGVDVLVSLGTAYLIAIAVSPNLLTLTNNIVLCILCLYTAYKFQLILENE